MSTIIFNESGDLRLIYDDDLVALVKPLGTVTVRRASHVEPAPDGEWAADLSPVKGPLLGPFTTRKEALAAEVAWLKSNDVPTPSER